MQGVPRLAQKGYPCPLNQFNINIVETVQKNLVSNMLGFIKREIFDTLKEWLVEPIYKAIDEMMRGHWL